MRSPWLSAFTVRLCRGPSSVIELANRQVAHVLSESGGSRLDSASAAAQWSAYATALNSGTLVRAHAALQDDKESVVDSSSPKDGSSGGSRRRARRYDVKDSDGPSNRSNRPESGRTKSASIPTSGKNEATGGRPIPSPVPSPAASSVNTSVGKRDDRTTWEDEEDNVLRRTLSQPLPGMSREAWRALKSGIVPGEFDHALAVATAYSRYNIPWAAQEHAAVHCLRSAVDGQRGWARAET